jgi:uroporphyrin-III C-methyltransferase/precorrin-2 dehydrogenase/sirohydrochlorin ferrochelatase
MDYFPIFLRLSDEPVLVVGGGSIAARKIELLQRCGARITVVAPRVQADIGERASSGALTHLQEEFHPGHLRGMRLVIAATDKHAVNAWVAYHADRDRIPVNVVDDRELSRFIVPGIVDRSPVVLAVSSGGDAPVLVRRLREMLETLLPTRLGALASLAGGLRRTVRARLANGGLRRRFWERFLEGPIAQDVLAGRFDADSQAVQLRIEDALRQAVRGVPATAAGVIGAGADATTATAVGESVGHDAGAHAVGPNEVGPNEVGNVVLAGAGPGDPSLLTLRALRALQEADVVLYDRLVSPAVLDLARRDAQRIFVGKAAGHEHVSQQHINEQLVQLARAGKRVCRLKGGDPFIFGRGGEELEALAAAGIRFEVVPGITAAAGCAAYAGIPLTHRDHAQAVTFVTGHCRDGSEPRWDLLTPPGQTVVFYMGLLQLETILQRLREHGAPAERPAALIEHGTLAAQRVLIGNLTTLPTIAREAAVTTPALLIVGEVARLHQTLQWFNATSGPVADLFTLNTSSTGRRIAGARGWQ